jgi:hypothetical protein
MQTDAVASRDVTIPAHFLTIITELLKSKPAEAWGLNPRTYRRYCSGDLPEQWEAILLNPDLALAVLRASFKIEDEIEPGDFLRRDQ